MGWNLCDYWELVALARAVLSDKLDQKCKVTHTEADQTSVCFELTADLSVGISVTNVLGQTKVLSCFVMCAILLHSVHALEQQMCPILTRISVR